MSANAATDSFSHRRDLAFLALFAALIHLCFFLVLPERMQQNDTTDYSLYYDPIARNLLEGKGYSGEGGRPGFIYPIGFPASLAAVFAVSGAIGVPEAVALKAFILLCGVLSALLLYLIGRRVFSRRIGWLAAIGWTTYPIYLWLTKQPNPESPFLVLMFGAVLAFLLSVEAQGRVGAALIAGLLAGLATLTRPIGVFLLLPMMVAVLPNLWRWPRGRRVQWVMAVVGVFALVLLPWEMYMRQETGRWILVSDNSRYSAYDGFTFALEPQENGQVLPVDPEVRDLMASVKAEYPRLPTAGAMLRYVLAEARERPGAVAKLFWLKTHRAWYATQAQHYEQYIQILQIPYLVLIVLGIWSAWTRYPEAHPYIRLAVLVTLYFWAMAVVVLPILRYMAPAIGLLMVVAAAGADEILIRVGAYRRLAGWSPEAVPDMQSEARS